MRYNPKKHRCPQFTFSGVLLVDKPSDWTSHDVVNFIRMRFNIPRVGHCGTLDPNATGLLVMVIGRFTKLSQIFTGEDKTYQATLLLGTETDTQDMSGRVTARRDLGAIEEGAVRAAILSFIGSQEQIPPMTSAVKKDGKKLYDLARQGIEIERDPKSITIYELVIDAVRLPLVDFHLRCSKGTYVRTLCADIGVKLGCGGVLYSLERTQSGAFSLADAVKIETVKNWSQEDLYQYMQNFLHEKIARLPGLNGF
jgi:tRNA pseudouridine55 synthase